jgi:hypothetical protein
MIRNNQNPQIEDLGVRKPLNTKRNRVIVMAVKKAVKDYGKTLILLATK